MAKMRNSEPTTGTKSPGKQTKKGCKKNIGRSTKKRSKKRPKSSMPQSDQKDVNESSELWVDENDLANLRASGLTDQTIKNNKLLTGKINGQYGLIFPYFDLMGEITGFSRIRPRNPRTDRKDKIIKYEQPGGIPPQPYYPVACLDDLNTRKQRILITEGEKKALSLSQAGYTSIGLGGVYGWKEKDVEQLISSMLEIDWNGRDVGIVFDWDEKESTRRTVDGAKRRLAAVLMLAGANEVYSVDLPPGPKNRKQGVDDYLVTHRVHEFQSLVDRAIPISTAATNADRGSHRKARPLDAYQPFPTDILPEPLSTYITEASESIGCDPAYIALPLLTALGATVGNSRRLVVKSTWLALPTLWAVIVGESGTAKTPALNAALSPIKRIQSDLLKRHGECVRAHEAETLKYEIELKKFKSQNNCENDPPTKPNEPHPNRVSVQDTTVEALAPILMHNPKGVLMHRDELAAWFGSFNKYSGKKGADEADWLSMHSGESITVDRKGDGTAPIHVPSAVVSITGGIQPGILKSVLSPEYRESGMAARILFALPPRTIGKWNEHDLSVEAVTRINAVFDSLAELEFATSEDGSQHPVEVKMGTEARKSWVNYYDSHQEEQIELIGDEAAAWSKLITYVPRIALLIHLVRCATDACYGKKVDADSMTIAIELVDWFKGEAARIYATLNDDRETIEMRRVIDWANRKHGGEVTLRQLVQGIKRINTVEEAETLLSRIVDSGLATKMVGDTGGRPRTYYKML